MRTSPSGTMNKDPYARYHTDQEQRDLNWNTKEDCQICGRSCRTYGYRGPYTCDNCNTRKYK